jgi:two-component system, OmpR family, alkaline phosphatase synthesis response regulator PhoP
MEPVGSPPTVLVVDDEPQVAWMLQFSLEAEGYHAVTARDGRSALEAIAEHRPQLILLDIMMPIVDGWGVLEQLNRMPEPDRPRVVMVSARTSVRDRDRAQALGAAAFISKPFDIDFLLGTVASLLGGSNPDARSSGEANAALA